MVDSPDTNWRKSHRSGTGDNCVEVASIMRMVAVRDSKNPGGGMLAFSRSEWRVFIGQVKGGDLGLN